MIYRYLIPNPDKLNGSSTCYYKVEFDFEKPVIFYVSTPLTAEELDIVIKNRLKVRCVCFSISSVPASKCEDIIGLAKFVQVVSGIDRIVQDRREFLLDILNNVSDNTIDRIYGFYRDIEKE